MTAIDTLIGFVAQSVATDVDLCAWCTGQFGRPPMVYVDIDDANPPAQDDYPVVAIHGVSRNGSLGRNGWSIDLDLACGLVNQSMDRASVASGAMIVTYAGMPQAARMMELVELAVVRALRGSYPQISVTGENGQVSEYPLFAAFSTLTIEQMPTSRSPRIK